MSAPAYAVGLVLLTLIVVPVTWGAVRARRRLLPRRSGAPARLAESILALSVVTVVGEVVGVVGLFDRASLVTGCAVVGLGMAAWGDGPNSVIEPDAPPVSLLGPAGTIGALLTVAGVLGQYVPRTVLAVHEGITNIDSLKYHLTFAARFAQTGSTTRLPYLRPEFPDTFHPAGTELIHGIAMALFTRDALSPVVNLGWLVLVLLAAWCVGRPFGVAPLSLVGVAIVVASPVLSLQDAGSAENDLAAMFFVLASVALLLERDAQSGRTAVAGFAAGLGLAAKLTVVGLVLALTAAVVVASLFRARGGGLRRVLAWLTPLALTGSFFYLRNWARVGTPVPSVDLHGIGLPAPKFATVERYGFSVAHYVHDTSVWRHYFLPGLHHSFGWVWWATFALAVAAVAVVAVSRAADPLTRLVGVVAAVGAAVYVVTPTTALGAPGKPVFFEGNVVYLTPSLALALAVLGVPAAARHGRRPHMLLGVLFAVLLATWCARALPAWPHRYLADGIAVALLVAVAGLLGVLAPRVGLIARSGSAVGAALLAVGIGYAPVAHAYVRDAYSNDPEWSWARGLTHTRIAIVGVGPQYPLYGVALSNRVQYVGTYGPHGEFHDVATCARWRHLLRVGDYDYVMVESNPLRFAGDPLTWTRTDPAASGVFRAGPALVFRFDPSVPDPGC